MSPPDLEAVNLQGERIAIEVTELVDECAIKKYKKTNEYDWADWDKNKFVDGLQYAISIKDAKYPTLKEPPYTGGYCLVIHTDEPELRYEVATEYQKGLLLEPPIYLDSVYLLLSYDPSVGHCPVFEIPFSERHG